MTTEYSFKSSVNALFDTHKDAYITPIAEVVTRSVESLKENLRHSDNWLVGNSDNDGTYFSIVERIPTTQFRGVHLDSTVVFRVYKHQILIDIKLPFNVSGEDAIHRLCRAADDAFMKSTMPCDFPITVTFKFADGREFYTVGGCDLQEGTEE